MAKVSAADRRKIEAALLRLMPREALEAWQRACEVCRGTNLDSRGWRYWHGRACEARSILEARACPPPAPRPIVPAVALCNCGEVAAPHDILCAECAVRADAGIDAREEHDCAHVEDGIPLEPTAPRCGWCGASVSSHGAKCALCAAIIAEDTLEVEG